MPRVKIDYVVSFSSEDPDNPASTLLEREFSKKKWLCGKGESSGSVVLQLVQAVQISAVHIGAYHSALVEVLVGRSEKPDEQFEVLVPSCVFLSPSASRGAGAGGGGGAGAGEAVRSFAGPQLAAPARDRKWDRVRVVCSQPYNKHCKFGLGFVQIYSPESGTGAASALLPVPALLPALNAQSSDEEEEFRPGELFAQHAGRARPAGHDTGAEIRRATARVLKSIRDPSAGLVRTSVARAAERGARPAACGGPAPGHAKTKEDSAEKRPSKVTDEIGKLNHSVERKREPRREQRGEASRTRKADSSEDRKPKADDSKLVNATPKPGGSHGQRSSDHQKECDIRKRRRPDNGDEHKGRGPAPEPRTLLAGTVLVLSGYENPRRARVRDAALALGARVERDWGPRCTHLICAFPNTPKLRAVRAGVGGAAVPVVRADWLDACARAARRLPWRAYATEPHLRTQPEPEPQSHDEPDCDTDEEIEKVLRERGKRSRKESSPPPAHRTASGREPSPSEGESANSSNLGVGGRHRKRRHSTRPPTADSDADRTDGESADVPTEPDLKKKISDSESDNPHDDIQASGKKKPNANSEKDTVDAYDVSTDEEEGERGAGAGAGAGGGALPDFLDGRSFVLRARRGAARLARYVRAYGGLVLDASLLDADSDVDFVVCARGGAGGGAVAGRRGAREVRPRWLWRCHAARALLPP